MLLTTRINHQSAIYPQLSRVWIKTSDPRVPLKAVWTSESQLHRLADQASASPRESETTPLAEDHLLTAA
jgi:hypothetical protein